MSIKELQAQVFEKTPLAVTINRVIFNVRGEPVDYKLVDASPSFEEKLGLEKSKVLGKKLTHWLLKHNSEQAKWLNEFAKVQATNELIEYSDVLEYNAFWYYVAAYKADLENVVIILHKAEMLKHASIEFHEAKAGLEAMLDATKAFSASIFDNSPFSIIIYRVEGDGSKGADYIIQAANPTCLELEGWKLEEIVGKPLAKIRPGVDEFGIISAFKKAYDTGKTVYFPARRFSEGGSCRWFENVIFKLPTGEVVAVYDEITKRKQAEEALFEEKEKLRVTLYSIGDGVITTDAQGRIDSLNEVAERLTGFTQDEAKGRPLTEVFKIYNETTGKACKNPVEMVLNSGSIVGLANHTVLKSRKGEEITIADSAAPIKNKDGETLGVVLVFRDLRESKAREEQIQFLIHRDTLTGLHNRTYFEEELKRQNEVTRFPLTLIMGDLDGLRLINDFFGHAAGDQALKMTAEVFKSCCRSTDIVSRWAGDTFTVLLPNTPEDVGQKIADRIKLACSEIEIADTKLSISVGCSTKTDKAEKWVAVIKRAEDSMHKSKLLGSKSYRSTVLASLKSTLFEKSFETEEHGERLGLFCREIGLAMGLPAHVLDEFEVLAMLHDVGKIAIDDRILQKPSALTPEEWVAMKKHPEAGFRIAQTVPELSGIADCILSHHERWDGKGYPNGLSGKEIPLLARILTVADAYDAMTQNRPYRKALSHEKARDELKKNSGTQFDPQIVAIFLEYLEQVEPDI